MLQTATFRALYLAKFIVLRRMEQHAGLYPVFAEESFALFGPARETVLPLTGHLPLNKLERCFQAAVGILFLGVLVLAIWG
jgi:hypothetical protein